MRAIGRRLKTFVLVLVPCTAGLYLYDFASRNQYEAFWKATPGALKLYGRAPDKRFVRSLAAVTLEARKQGFRFGDPQMVQTNSLFDFWYIRWTRMGYIGVETDTATLILVDGRGMKEFSDEELNCVMAHEVGHIIDFGTNREGHPVFERIWCLSNEQFADSIGRLLCGYEPYQQVMRLHIKTRPLVVTQICGQRPLQP